MFSPFVVIFNYFEFGYNQDNQMKLITVCGMTPFFMLKWSLQTVTVH